MIHLSAVGYITSVVKASSAELGVAVIEALAAQVMSGACHRISCLWGRRIVASATVA